MMIFVSILSISRSLTTTEMRENTIRINALELVKVEKEQEKEQVKETPKKEVPKKVTVVMDERTLLFDFDKSVVKEEYVPILRNLIAYMVENNYDVTIVGHTDSKGSEVYNEKLSLRILYLSKSFIKSFFPTSIALFNSSSLLIALA